MAKTTVITDDLDQRPDASTVTFSVDGVEYWLDLTDENKTKLLGALDPFTSRAEELGNTRKLALQTAKTGGTRSLAKAKTIRAWGNKNGYPTERGPLPKDLINAYNSAFGNPA